MAKELLTFGNEKISAKEFTFEELAAATDEFNPNFLLGEGGFGNVFKGYIDSIQKVYLSLFFSLT